MALITRIEPDPVDVSLVAKTEGALIRFVAHWRKIRRVGFIQGRWQGCGELLISDLMVENDALLSRTPFLPFEKRGNFRQLGVGKRLLLEMVSYAAHNGGERIYGSIVSDDVKGNGDLLDWYRREGFTIREPDEKCLKNAVAMIVMKLDAEGRNRGENG